MSRGIESTFCGSTRGTSLPTIPRATSGRLGSSAEPRPDPGRPHPSDVHGWRGVEEAAQKYDALLGDLLRDGPVDLCVMGMGADGHTASLFPGSPALTEQMRRAVAAPGAGPVRERITLTPPVLAASRLNLFLVTGTEKSAALRAVLEPEAGAAPLPAALISGLSRHAESLRRRRSGIALTAQCADVPLPRFSFRSPHRRRCAARDPVDVEQPHGSEVIRV